MYKIAAFMITRDRLDYTKRTLKSIYSDPGMEFDLYVFDNGSTDKTQDWLAEEAYNKYNGLSYWLNTENYGIHIGANKCIRWIKEEKYDFIMKIDNDIEMRTKSWLSKLMEAHDEIMKVIENETIIFSPNIKGLMYPPPRIQHFKAGKYKCASAPILGGICRVHPVKFFDKFRFNERQPLATGGDVLVANYCKEKEIPLIYVENIIGYHMDTTEGQMKEKEEYFNRSWYERYLPYGA